MLPAGIIILICVQMCVLCHCMFGSTVFIIAVVKFLTTDIVCIFGIDCNASLNDNSHSPVDCDSQDFI